MTNKKFAVKDGTVYKAQRDEYEGKIYWVKVGELVEFSDPELKPISAGSGDFI